MRLARDPVDDLGGVCTLPPVVSRVVSLVPSLTDAVAASAAGLLVGATDWCSHPLGLDVARIGGTKSPDLDGVLALRPDLVVANEEENRSADLQALRDNGIAVWVTAPRTVPAALVSLGRMLAACGVDTPDWLAEAEQVWAPAHTGPRRTAVVPIWRRPWMALGRDTFAGDVLARLGIDHVLAAAADRYPRIVPADLPQHDLVVFPDEPYAFGPGDGPEAFAAPPVFVSGRHLTWYGPSLRDARALLTEQLAGRP